MFLFNIPARYSPTVPSLMTAAESAVAGSLSDRTLSDLHGNSSTRIGAILGVS